MNKKLISTMAAALVLGLLAGRYWLPAQSTHKHDDEAEPTSSTDAQSQATIWTCSMHPQIRQNEPGDCPICGMDLIPLLEDGGGDEGPRTLTMSESSRALAEIQTSEVVKEFPEAQVRLVGKLEYDETLVKALTARFPARIDELFVNYTGVAVKPGEHLAKIYSPELLTAQRELLSAYQRDPNSSITQAARDKLSLWDLLPDQIDEIIESGEARDHFVLRAPIGGIVVAKNVKEGDYIKTGEALFKIVDLSQLWLYLSAYESDLTWLRYGQDVAFTVEAFPGKTFHGQIAFIDPEVNRRTRTVMIRVNVPNDGGQLKPGMFAQGIVEAKLAEGGRVFAPEFAGKWISPMHPEIVKDGPGVCDVCGMDLVPAEELGYVQDAKEQPPIVIPASAVLRTGKRAVVYVEKPDSERPTYEGREIVLGPRAGNSFIVEAGLDTGERVVTNGAFKIDSALQIKAKPSMMNPEGGGSMPGHNHGSEMPTESQAEMQMLEIPTDQAAQLLAPYLKLQSALANDNLEAAKNEAKAMMKITGHSGPLPELLHDMLAAENLDELRKPSFEKLSDAMIMAAKASPAKMGQDLLVMHCPMVHPDRGADWLQASEPLQNPYFGQMMLQCGEVTETIANNQAEASSHVH